MADSPALRISGRLTEFNPQSDNISSYLERLELYFEAKMLLKMLGKFLYC